MGEPQVVSGGPGCLVSLTSDRERPGRSRGAWGRRAVPVHDSQIRHDPALHGYGRHRRRLVPCAERGPAVEMAADRAILLRAECRARRAACGREILENTAAEVDRHRSEEVPYAGSERPCTTTRNAFGLRHSRDAVVGARIALVSDAAGGCDMVRLCVRRPVASSQAAQVRPVRRLRLRSYGERVGRLSGVWWKRRDRLAFRPVPRRRSYPGRSRFGCPCRRPLSLRTLRSGVRRPVSDRKAPSEGMGVGGISGSVFPVHPRRWWPIAGSHER